MNTYTHILRWRQRFDLDTAGAAASFLCAVHCAVMPFILTLLPLIGLSFLASEPVEWGLLALSALLGVSSLCFGYRRHRRGNALAFLAVGLALLAGGHGIEARGAEAWGTCLVVAGGLTIAFSHQINHRLCRACRTCHPKTG